MVLHAAVACHGPACGAASDAAAAASGAKAPRVATSWKSVFSKRLILKVTHQCLPVRCGRGQHERQMPAGYSHSPLRRALR